MIHPYTFAGIRFSEPMRVGAERIIQIASQVSGEDLMLKSRLQKIVIPRQVAMCIIYEECYESYMSIGRMFGKDHSSVIYSVNQVREMRRLKDEKVLKIYNAVKRTYRLENGYMYTPQD